MTLDLRMGGGETFVQDFGLRGISAVLGMEKQQLQTLLEFFGVTVCICTALGAQALPQPKHGCRGVIPTAIKLQGSSHQRI